MAEPRSALAPGRRIGLLGGTFDPPHRAHAALAERALTDLALDAVWWVPAGDPWQKRGARPITPAADRREMVQRALALEPRFRVEDVELRRAGPSYAIDTVRELAARHPGVAWVWILGEDAYRGLPTWKDWTALAALVTFAVARRAPSHSPGGSSGGSPGGWPATTPDPLPAHPGVRWQELAMPPLDLSSTALRAAAAAGLPLGDAVEAEVARYIASRRLYAQPPTASTDAGSAPADT